MFYKFIFYVLNFWPVSLRWKVPKMWFTIREFKLNSYLVHIHSILHQNHPLNTFFLSFWFDQKLWRNDEMNLKHCNNMLIYSVLLKITDYYNSLWRYFFSVSHMINIQSNTRAYKIITLFHEKQKPNCSYHRNWYIQVNVFIDCRLFQLFTEHRFFFLSS